MPDIAQPETVRTVERRLEGRSQGGGRPAVHEPAAKKAVATYEEAAKTKPADDRITILGIPVEQITPATQAALGGLVAEINFLRGVVKRQERAARKPDNQNSGVLEPEAFVKALGGALAQPPVEPASWAIVLIHVPTYEDIRRSSGLLAANGVLADVAQRVKDFQEAASFTLVGYAGGSNLAGLTALAPDQDAAELARAVRTRLTTGGYAVGGIEMALVIKVAVALVGAGESATLALGRADHLLRSST